MDVVTDVVLQGVLDRLKQTVDVEIEDYDDEEEWFELSGSMEDSDLFLQIKMNWNQIVGLEDDEFALIYCMGGPDSGVWLHYFEGTEYAPGCHQVPAW